MAEAKEINQFVPYLIDFIKLKTTCYLLEERVPVLNGILFPEIQLLKTEEMTSNKRLQVFFFLYVYT